MTTIRNRKGKIRISNAFLSDIDNNIECFKKLFSVFVPIETHRPEFESCTYYYGLCEMFEEIVPGSISKIPEYDALFTQTEDGLSISFERI